ncbi:DUF2460 domain-containing protein [Arvimicrobium flavum]|uniref:DUF2460 domain-containing protein n=1 Tax=Arvimicrobium flavum TaxID=3393320 RepID=UPI00237B8AAC|nr:DUF2460 domain-containing protein [Mesorhizobium shangrilense]
MTELSSFHDVLFPTAVSFGATGGPERRNEIVLMTSGRERRNLRTAHSRRTYDAGTGVKSIQNLYDILAFFEARRGSFHAFRFRDPFDNRSCRPEETPAPADQVLGTGDGTRIRFALVKTYGSGADAYRRPIRKPLLSGLRIAVAGAEKGQGADFSFDDATGEIVFAAAPATGAAVTAGYHYDVPVRFDAERMSVSLTSFRAGQIPTIPLIEVLQP